MKKLTARKRKYKDGKIVHRDKEGYWYVQRHIDGIPQFYYQYNCRGIHEKTNS